MDICLLDYQSTSAAGNNLDELRAALSQQRSGLRANDFPRSDLPTWIGRVSQVDDIDLGEWQSRNNALAHIGISQGTILENVEQLKSRFAPHRVGLVMGSSTSSIDRTETAYTDLTEAGTLKPQFQQEKVHNPHAPSLYVAHLTGVTGPALTINTACSSSAKVFATGARWLKSGIVDAVLVGGVDTLCLSVLHGFDSLQLISQNPCRPFDQDRDGINLGEAAGFAILVRKDETENSTGIELLGYGESSDAYHMSHPHPDGLGAKLSMEQALSVAKLRPKNIDYINLHGTSSRANDSIEGKLINQIFPKTTRCSSTKAWMGHTLGAAGITEAIIALDTISTGIIPGSMNLSKLDDGLDMTIQAENVEKSVDYAMTNSFGFGGNNCSLVFGRENLSRPEAGAKA